MKRDFRVNEDVFRAPDSQANHWSYELAACLCTDTQSPLRGRCVLKQGVDAVRGQSRTVAGLSRGFVKSLTSKMPWAVPMICSEVEVFQAFASMYARNPRPAWAYGGENLI